MGSDPTPAWTAWSSLPERTQLEVGHLARLGVRHPNSEVAEVAGAWASVLLSSADHEAAQVWWTGLATSASIFLVDPAAVAEMADRRAWRGWAEQVLAANAGAHPYRIPLPPAAQPRHWSEEERRRQFTVLVPVMLVLVGVLVFVAVLVTRT